MLVFVLALLAFIFRVDGMLHFWWLLGAVTLFWSLTPATTLTVSLWEVGYVAAFAFGTYVYVFFGLSAFLLMDGLFTVLSLASAGMSMFFSGSSSYVAGAQALTLIPITAVFMFRSRWQLLSGLMLTASIYLALMSGSRAVYFSLVVVVLLSIWRLWNIGIRLKPLSIASLVIVALILTINQRLPFDTLTFALTTKASLSQQLLDSTPEGSFGSRLQMWSQTLNIAFDNPSGTGNGSFRDVLAAYQQFPGIGFANAHNYYLETAATGGWLRLGLLLWFVGSVALRGWYSKAWPWALGAAGLWSTLAFDITGMYPSVMMLAFASLGVVYGQLEHKPISYRILSVQKWTFLIITAALIIWWYWPCSKGCSVTRHFGYRPEVLADAAQLSGKARSDLLKQAEELNPKSLWVCRSKLQYATSDFERLEVLRQINHKFPVSGPGFYLEHARIAAQLAYKAEAIETLQIGLRIFPIGFKPAGVPLGDSINKAYKEWEKTAPKLLAQLKSQP